MVTVWLCIGCVTLRTLWRGVLSPCFISGLRGSYIWQGQNQSGSPGLRLCTPACDLWASCWGRGKVLVIQKRLQAVRLKKGGIQAGLLCLGEGPGGSAALGESLFCSVLCCFLTGGAKALMSWVWKACDTTLTAEGLGDELLPLCPAWFWEGWQQGGCVHWLHSPLRPRLRVADGVALFITPEGAPAS